MRIKRLGVGIGLLLALACCQRGAALTAGDGQPCKNQSPRRLENYDQRSDESIVEPGLGDTIFYRPRGGGKTVRLERCSQHYHCQIENFEPECPGQHPTLHPAPTCGPVAPGSWVEIHTAYAAEVVRDQSCDPESLDCCKGGPIVVAAYHARVVGSSIAAPVPPRFGQKRAEWLGSSTGPEKPPGECKQPAEWSFTLGCEFTVTSGQLSVFEHPEPARALQPPDRLSHPLVLVNLKESTFHEK